eukprot:885497_1
MLDSHSWRLADKVAMDLIPAKTLHKMEKQGTTWQAIRFATHYISHPYKINHTPVHNITNNNMNQAILPIQMRPKPAKHAPKIANPNAKHAGKERSQSTMNFGSQSTMERKDRKAQCCDT